MDLFGIPEMNRSAAIVPRLVARGAATLCLALAPLAVESGSAYCPHATNSTTSTLCAEEDNVNVAFTGAVSSFVIEATHPAYAVGADSCTADLTNCPPPGTSYPFTPGVFKLFDDGVTVVEAVREPSWWRPNGMSASVDGSGLVTDIHFVRLYRKIADAASWPQFFVLYMDGNLRLIPHPPLGTSPVCFGSSVVVGPAAPAARPIAEIASVNYVSSTMNLEVRYATGGTATLSLSEVDRTRARVLVTVGYATDALPYATFRSMYVADGNADVDHVSWRGPQGASGNQPITSLPSTHGTEFFFYRQDRSRHNTSAPDIRIRAAAAGCASAFFSTVPCRLADTREAPGTFGGPALPAGSDRVLPLHDRCGIPTTAVAAAVNVTVTQPTANGRLTLYPAGSALPLASSINYVAGQTRANNAIAPLNTLGELAVHCGQSSGSVHLVLDVTGYFE